MLFFQASSSLVERKGLKPSSFPGRATAKKTDDETRLLDEFKEEARRPALFRKSDTFRMSLRVSTDIP